MENSVNYLSLKPELVGDVKTDQELFDRIKQFAKMLYEYNPGQRTSLKL